MEKIKIVLLAGKGDFTNIVYNKLCENYSIETAIIENKEDMKRFIKRRIKRLGIFTVMGQIAFQFFIVKPLAFFSRKKVRKIFLAKALNVNPIPEKNTINVSSVNADSTLALLQKIQPDLVIVNGTRIISKKILNGINCKFINTHVGITPKYRGVHGTYWALVNNDLKNSGVTVHFVDAGIDTGNIIAQAQVKPTSSDNFITYPYLQLAAGITLLENAVNDFIHNKIKEQSIAGESNLYYHPTIFQYLYYRIFKHVK
jgi:folate-dependent phosphoribosylglycinamide formyltransferase PurN